MENILGTNLDRIVILAYFAVVMGFGAYFGKTRLDRPCWQLAQPSRAKARCRGA